MVKKECVLYDRDCIECGECELCDLDPGKKCDNCCRCLDEVDEYRTVYFEEFMDIQEEKEIIDNYKQKEKDQKN